MSETDAGDWTAVAVTVDQIITDSGNVFPSKARAQVHDFLRLVRDRCPIPGIGLGYLRTSVRFSWTHTARGPIEIEVFEDHFEIYRFYDKRTDIRHVARAPGEPFPDYFLAELPTSEKSI